MRIKTTGTRIVWVLVFLLGLAVGVYVLFPTRQLESSVQSRLNRHLPDRLQVSDLRFQTPLDYTVTLDAKLPEQTLRLPLDLRVRVHRFRLVMPVRGSPARSLSGLIDPFSRSLTLNLKNFPLSKLLPRQTGVVDGSLHVRFNRGRRGGFEFRVRTDPLVSSAIVPPVLSGVKVRRLHLLGELGDRSIHVQDLTVYGPRIHAEGSLDVRLRSPLERSLTRVNLRVSKPLRTTLRRSLRVEQLHQLLEPNS